MKPVVNHFCPICYFFVAPYDKDRMDVNGVRMHTQCLSQHNLSLEQVQEITSLAPKDQPRFFAWFKQLNLK